MSGLLGILIRLPHIFLVLLWRSIVEGFGLAWGEWMIDPIEGVFFSWRGVLDAGESDW